MRLAIGDIEPCPNDTPALPIGDEFCTSSWPLTDKGPCGEEMQQVLSERQPQVGGFGRQFTFQLLWQAKHDTHDSFLVGTHTIICFSYCLHERLHFMAFWFVRQHRALAERRLDCRMES